MDNVKSDLKQKSFKFQSSDSVITTLVALSCEPTLRLQLEFRDRLDIGRLKAALRDLVKFEPILSTRLILSDKPYYSSVDINENTLVFVTSSKEEYERFRNLKIDIEKGPLFSCILYQADKKDILLFKFAHEAADGYGTVEAVKFVAKKYSTGKDYTENNHAHDTYHPLSRSPQRLLQQFGWKEYPKLFWLNCKEKLGYFLPAGTMSYHTGEPGLKDPAFYTKSFDADMVAAMRVFSKKHGVTVNDMLLAAFLRASAGHVGFNGKEALRILMTINLRGYIVDSNIPSSEICNLSGMECINLKKNLGKDFLDTAMRVSKVTKRKKKDGIGLSFLFDLFLQEKMKFKTLKKVNQSTRDMVMKTRNFAMTVTNVGRVDSNIFRFDQEPLDLELFAPLTYAPFWCSLVYEFNGILKLGCAVEEKRLNLLEKLYDSVEFELRNAI